MRSVPSTDGLTLTLHHLADGRADRPDGRRALFAHATGFHGSLWGPVARHLPQLDSWALDFRAHGDSVVPPGQDLSWDRYADDVLAVADDLHLDQAVGIGHSMGGAALLMAEHRRPGTFGCLWLYEPVVFPPDILVALSAARSGPNPMAAAALRRRERFDSTDAALANYAAKPPLNVFTPEALSAYVEFGFAPAPDGSVALKCRPADEAATFEMTSRHLAWDSLPTVRCPVLVVRGRVEPNSPSRAAEAIVARLANGHLEIHEALGHFGPMEDPPAMAASISRFVERHPPRTGSAASCVD